MNKILLLFILIIAALIRLATLSKLSVFTSDQSYLLYIVQTIIEDLHIIWIGVSALGLDFYMGPWWIYFIYPFVALFKGDPLILNIISSLQGVLTVLLLYWLGSRLFSQRIGLISALIYATSSLIIYYDQQSYPSGVSLLSLSIASSLYLIKKSDKWLIIFAVLYGLIFHIHLSLILLIFPALYWVYLNRRKIARKTIVVSILVFLLTISPLIVFDYFHKWSNIMVPLRVLSAIKDKSNETNTNNRFGTFLGTLSRVWYLEPHKNNADEILYPCFSSLESTTTKPRNILWLLTLGLLFTFILKKKTWKEDKTRLLLFLSFSFVIPFLFIPVINPIEYYLLGFFPLLFLIIAYTIDSLSKPLRLVAYILLIIFSLHGIFTVTSAPGDFGLEAKKTLIKKVFQIVKDRPYALAQEGNCHKYGGWRYLFSTYGRRPERSSEDLVFGWLYPKQISQTPVKYSVVVKEKRTTIPVDNSYKFFLEEGGFSAYIYEY